MLEAMRPRAPDGIACLDEGPARLGQSFLRTGSACKEAPNRITFDGKVFIVADARIDARADLIAILRQRGRQVDDGAPHAELVLHAYHALGDKFLDHIIGDFAFALWDGVRKRLTCVRDQLGIRPLYFAHNKGEFLFASDIAALLCVPGIGRELDDIAVAQFLSVGMCMEPDRTIYRSLKCLPAGCRIDVDETGLRETRYWQPSWGKEVRFRKRRDYVDAFGELFESSVRDRLPAGPAGISFSGGMDSTSIAAVARGLNQPITGYHVSTSSFEPDDEETPHAEEAARFLGMRLEIRQLGDYGLFARNGDRALRTALPASTAQLAMLADQFSSMGTRGERVNFDGYMGDALFAPSDKYFAGLIRSGRVGKFILEAGRHVSHTRSLRGMNLRSLFPEREKAPSWKPGVPEWIDPAFARKTQFAERWENWWSGFQSTTDPAAQFLRPWMGRQFEFADVLPVPVVTRYPFIDLRLIEFMVGVPNFVRGDKMLLREAMVSRLPEAVRKRPKTALVGDPYRKLMTNGKFTAWAKSDAVRFFVDLEAFERACVDYTNGRNEGSTWPSVQIILTIAWANWIAQSQECNT